MNKTILAIIGAVIIIGGGAALVINKGSDKNTVKVTNPSNGKTVEVQTGDSAIINVDACEVLTQNIADQVLGSPTTKGDTTAGNASSADVSVSNCTYFIRPTEGTALDKINNTKTVSVLVRSAKTKNGADANKAIFKTTPAGNQNVTGVGDKAFFNPKLGQLDILKGNNYYIINNSVGSPTKGTLEGAKTLADAIGSNLK